MTPLEKMAMALDPEAFRPMNVLGAAYHRNQARKERARDQARAALQSLLQPDDSTVEAMVDAWDFAPPTDGSDQAMSAAFTAAINNILRETP